jgi:hypothetical protein
MQIRVNVDAPADKIVEFSSGAKLYWARDNTSSAGAFADASGFVALVATQSQYEIVDTGGALGHFYRTRIGNTGGTLFDEWSTPFQAGAVAAYASLDALREYISAPDDSPNNLLSDLLVDASGYLDARCERNFYRHPAVTGTEVRTFDGSGTHRLRVRLGIISLDTVEVAVMTGAPYTATTSYLLAPADKPDADPYSTIVLTGLSSPPVWYRGYATVKLTGVFGWSAVPALIRKATLDLAREWYRQGPGGGGPVGINQFGTPIFGGAEPKSVKDAIAQYGPALVG